MAFPPRPSIRRPLVRGTVALAIAGLTLSGCTAENPTSEFQLRSEEPIVISVNPNSMEQAVLGEIYHQVLQGHGRESSVVIATDSGVYDRMERVQSSETNFVIGCTGDMLASMNSQATEEVIDEFSAGGERTNVNDTEFLQRTYDEFVGSLPGYLMTTDPSPAQGCAGPGEEQLPQNIVPVFNKGLFDRGEVGAINGITRALNTAEVEKLVERARRQGSVSSVVEDWFASGSVQPEEQIESGDTTSDDD